MFRRLLYSILPKRRKIVNTSFLSGGALVDPVDTRDFVEPLSGAGVYPGSFSLVGNGLTQIEHQGQYNSCVAHAITTAVETFSKNNGYPHNLELSRMHVWNEARKLSGTYPNNEGCYIRDGWKVTQKNGITIEKLFPYVPDSFNSEVGLAGQMFANFYEPFTYKFIYDNFEDKIKDVLVNQKVPVVFAIPIPMSFMNPDKNKVYKPQVGEQNRFNHAMIVIGYDDEKNAFLIRNSWGLNWGWNGNLWVDKTWFLSNAYSFSYPGKVIV